MYKLALTIAALALLTGCQQPHTQRETSASAPTAPAKPKVEFSETYDAEIKAIMEQARESHWEEARTQADALLAREPQNPMLQRLQTWVAQQAHNYREQALEDEIRKVDAKNSVFNPTIPGLLEEQKDRGLPARKDVRDTVDRIENSSYIPETYGKTIRQKGPLFELDSTNGPMAQMLEKPVAIHLDNVPLETIIVQISQSAGINIVADKSLPALKQVLNVNLEKVKLGEFLRYIGRNYDLQFQVGQDLIWVVDAKDPKRLMEETRFYRLRKGFILPAQFGSEDQTRPSAAAAAAAAAENRKYKTFVNDDAPAVPSLERAITNLFTGSKYMIDYERNLVVARGTPEQLQILENIIREFDQPIQQVLIEARFVTLSKPAFLQLGALWETGRSNQVARGPRDFTGLVGTPNIPNLGVGIQETFTNILGRNDLSATITAMEQSGESQTLSAPRLTVLNNRPATISDGKVQYYYDEYQVKSTVQAYYSASTFVPSGKPARITSGVELNVMASISGDGKHIVLALNPRVNTDVQLVTLTTLTDYQSTDPTKPIISTFDLKLPEYRTQELATRVVVKSGETVVMGGVLEREKSTFVEAVPVLGNIPVLGALFRRRTEVDKPRYLLVFVTATILTDSGEFLVYE